MMSCDMKAIPTYIINLNHRTLRRRHILDEFKMHEEFHPIIVDAIKHSRGAIGLWQTIQYILRDLAEPEIDFVILCEDDHQFTSEYSKERLFSCIKEAKERDTDILSGGVSGFTNALPVAKSLYWVEKFSGLQFSIIFRNFFNSIIETDFNSVDAADYRICSLTEKKFFIHPFISIQKDFGYSDATPKNNSKNITELFDQADTKVKLLKEVSSSYTIRSTEISSAVNSKGWSNINIPTYVIHLPERKERRKSIEEQFNGKPEFDVNIVKACRHKVGAVGLWQSIRKITKKAQRNGDDVIIICEDDHVFTPNYQREVLIRNIFKAYEMGSNLLLGGIGGFDAALQITEDLWWINSFWCTQFTVIFRNFFNSILNEPFENNVAADDLYSEMTSNKLVLYPFISIQKEFGYSDCTDKNNKNTGLVENLFSNSGMRMKELQRKYSEYGLNKSLS